MVCLGAAGRGWALRVDWLIWLIGVGRDCLERVAHEVKRIKNGLEMGMAEWPCTIS